MYRYFSALKAITVALVMGAVILGCGTESEESGTDATLILGKTDGTFDGNLGEAYTEECLREYNGIIDRLITFAANFQSPLFKKLYKHYKCGEGDKLILGKEELELIVKQSKNTRKPLNWVRFGKANDSKPYSSIELSVDTESIELGTFFFPPVGKCCP